jgi:hypothetical protein
MTKKRRKGNATAATRKDVEEGFRQLALGNVIMPQRNLLLADQLLQFPDAPLIFGDGPILDEGLWSLLQKGLLPGSNGVWMNPVRFGHLVTALVTFQQFQDHLELNFGV